MFEIKVQSQVSDIPFLRANNTTYLNEKKVNKRTKNMHQLFFYFNSVPYLCTAN